MTLTPLHSYCVVRLEEEDKTKSGLILTNKKPTGRATVIQCSSAIQDVEPGDYVMINQYSPLEVPDTEFHLIDYMDIYGIINE